ncbi:MAG: hypothetical protein AAGA90_11595 [Actinomycetota bacterium]
MSQVDPDDLDDSAVSLLMLSNLAALVVAAVVGLLGLGLAALVGAEQQDAWQALETRVLAGFGTAAVAYLVVLALAVNRWLAPGRGAATAAATFLAAIGAGIAAGVVLVALDDGAGATATVVAWLSVGLVVVAQAVPSRVLPVRVATTAGVAILGLMVVAGAAL